MRQVMIATYAVLIVTLVVFIGVAAGTGGLSGKTSAGWSIFLFAYVQIMAAGLFVGLAGVLIHRKYTPHRRDRQYGGQRLCILVSVLGLALYLLLA